MDNLLKTHILSGIRSNSIAGPPAPPGEPAVDRGEVVAGFFTPGQALLQQLGLDIKISFYRGVAVHS